MIGKFLGTENRQNSLLLGRLRTTFTEKNMLDITATKDSCGILKGENGNLPKLFGSLLSGLLDFERKVFGQIDNLADKNQIDTLSDLAETVSFFSRILYLDPKEEDDSFLKRYTIKNSAILYAPYNSKSHLKEIYPAANYNFLTPATIETEITDIEKSRKLVLGSFPVTYSYYHRAANLAGAPIEEGLRALHERRRSRAEGVHETVEVVDKARKTLVEPYFYIRLEDTNSNVIFELRGIPKQAGEYVEVEFKSEKFPDYSIKFPLTLNLKDPKKEFANLDPFNKQMVALTKTLLGTTLKNAKDMNRLYK